jgi:hypothetical protein
VAIKPKAVVAVDASDTRTTAGQPGYIVMQLDNIWYYLLWAGLFFVMMRFGCGAHVMGHGHHHDGSDKDRALGSGTRLPPPERD